MFDILDIIIAALLFCGVLVWVSSGFQEDLVYSFVSYYYSWHGHNDYWPLFCHCSPDEKTAVGLPTQVDWEYPQLAKYYHVRDAHSVRVVILGSAANYGHVLFRNCAAFVEKEGDWIAHWQKSKAYREAGKVVTMLVTIVTVFAICWLLIKKLEAYGVIILSTWIER